MFEKFFEYFSINNPSQLIWPLALTIFLQIFSFVSWLTFLGLLIWSIIKMIRERKINPSSKKYLPRLLGFLFSFLVFLALFIFSAIHQNWV